ncbi:MAG: hypothetical protein QGG73_07185 [Candidatus Hydrogenedentes bacterium]|nr:hypothetical protein [Candidatus Hydrogenedentota bacterium]
MAYSRTYRRWCATSATVQVYGGQWRTLQLNPLLEEYDFLQRTDCACLYRAVQQPEDFALLLEEPRLCRACVEFYLCLGVEPEVEALDAVIGGVRSMSNQGFATRPG